VVAAGLADRCAIQIAYAIGVAKPLSLYVDCYGTSQVAEERLEKLLGEVMDLTPRGIREHLGLNRSIYARTSAYGHFGRRRNPTGAFPGKAPTSSTSCATPQIESRARETYLRAGRKWELSDWTAMAERAHE
jgi:S-adenosylmethionine synthetase